MAENARQQSLVDKWLQAKIDKTYVRIDSEWRNCEFKYDGWLR